MDAAARTSPFAHPAPQAATEDDAVGRRIGATLVDALVVFAAFYAGIRILGGQPTVGTPETVAGFFFWFVFSVLGFAPLLVLHGFSPVWFLAAAAVWAGYAAALEGLFGQTVGKRLFGVVVVTEGGDACTFRAAVLRNAGRVVDALFFYGVGLLVLAVTERRQRFGDLVGRTVVVTAGAR